jgi:hypothetical protein
VRRNFSTIERWFFGPRNASHGREGRNRSIVGDPPAAVAFRPEPKDPAAPKLPGETPRAVEPPGLDRLVPEVTPDGPDLDAPDDVRTICAVDCVETSGTDGRAGCCCVGSGDVDAFGTAGTGLVVGSGTGCGTVGVGVRTVVDRTGGTGTVVVGRVGAGAGKVGVVRVTVGTAMAGVGRLARPNGTPASAVPTQAQRASMTARTVADFITWSTREGPIW